MPLVAISRDQERIVSSLVPAPDWATMKHPQRGDFHLEACGCPCHPKTSKLGLQSFSHYGNSGCTSGPETEEHLMMKALIASAADALGYLADVEVRQSQADPEWVADVLMTDGDRMVVVEIQHSPQSPDDYLRRQRRYEEAGLDCVWLSATVPGLDDFPAYAYSYDPMLDEALIYLPEGKVGPVEFVRRLMEPEPETVAAPVPPAKNGNRDYPVPADAVPKVLYRGRELKPSTDTKGNLLISPDGRQRYSGYNAITVLEYGDYGDPDYDARLDVLEPVVQATDGSVLYRAEGECWIRPRIGKSGLKTGLPSVIFVAERLVPANG